EALTMAYLRQQGVDTCIARIFNSILADEQILFDDGRELQRMEVGQLAARLKSRALSAAYQPLPSAGGTSLAVEPVPAVEHPLRGFSVPAFGAGGVAIQARAATLIAHPPSGPCYEIRT